VLILRLLIIFIVWIVSHFVFADTPLDFSISDNVISPAEYVDIEFNINNSQRVPLVIYGYSTKGVIELFDEDLQKWLVSNTSQLVTTRTNKIKVRLTGIDNQETQIHFFIVDNQNTKSYQTVFKYVWVGSYELDYINALNEHLLSTQSSSSISVPKPASLAVERPAVSVSTPVHYIGIGLLALSGLVIIVFVFVMIKYNNAPNKKLAASDSNNGNYISSLCDTWESVT
jgi:hypothetical protein